jgi:hypothetical protein
MGSFLSLARCFTLLLFPASLNLKHAGSNVNDIGYEQISTWISLVSNHHNSSRFTT